MEFPVKESVLQVINTIENAGGEAFIVGGCVRDILLGDTPDDFDVTTSLPPEKVASLFSKTVATGIKHGTVTVIVNGESIEVTTYRTDGVYSDSRHPQNVSFVGNLYEDLARRDFTVNAIAYNPKVGLVDRYGGINDLKNSVLKAVGEPKKRFEEDALRIMRLFRFACKLGFSIDEETEKQALNLSHNLKSISRERIAGELFKSLLSPHPERLTPLLNTGALEFCGIHVGEGLEILSALPPDKSIRFYKFISLLKGDHLFVCQQLKTDKALYNYCKDVTEILSDVPKSIIECKIALKRFDKTTLCSALTLSGADTKTVEKIIESGEPYKVAHLALSGNDLIKLNYSGKAVGELLEKLTLYVIEHPSQNNKESLLRYLNK